MVMKNSMNDKVNGVSMLQMVPKVIPPCLRNVDFVYVDIMNTGGKQY